MVKDVLFHNYKGKKKFLELIHGEKKFPKFARLSP